MRPFLPVVRKMRITEITVHMPMMGRIVRLKLSKITMVSDRMIAIAARKVVRRRQDMFVKRLDIFEAASIAVAFGAAKRATRGFSRLLGPFKDRDLLVLLQHGPNPPMGQTDLVLVAALAIRFFDRVTVSVEVIWYVG